MGASFESEPERLNGWKEIARHLGKGTRTAQRWERLYGLPVHRIGREGGEIVFAFRDEIERWLATTERERTAGDGETAQVLVGEPSEAAAAPALEPPAGPSAGSRPPQSRTLGRLLAPILILAAALATVAILVARRPAAAVDGPKAVSEPGRHPTSWRLANESLVVFDGKGSPLFEHRFGFSFPDDLRSESWHDPHIPAPVLIADVDGDGQNEVLVPAPATERANRRLYCFEADGRTRWVRQPTGIRRFGDDDYAEPWLARGVFVTRGPAGTKRVWASFTHNLMFPSVLQELDPRDGSVRQEYWSDGYIEVVSEGSWAGRPVVFVGGTNNDFRAASLAVFPPDRVAGSTPAVRPAYACRNCAPGGPETLFLFPTLCLTRDRGQAGLFEVWVEQGDRVRVSVSQGPASAGTATYYTLGANGTLLTAEISREFQARHALLERQGVVDHAFGATDDRDMFPVRRWDGARFVDLPRVKVAH